MARIREYENKENIDPGPVAAAGRDAQTSAYYASQAIEGGIRSAAQATAKIEDVFADEEVSRIAAKAADLDISMTQQYDEAKKNADPNDPNFAQNFVDKTVGPSLDKLQDEGAPMTEKGRKYLERVNLEMRGNFVKRAFADQSIMAANTRVANAENVANKYALSASVDPTMTQANASMIDTVLAPLIPAAQRAEWVTNAKQAVYANGAARYVSILEGNPNTKVEDIVAMQKFMLDPKNGFSENMDAGKFASVMRSLDDLKVTRHAVEQTALDASFSDVIEKTKQFGDPDGVGKQIIEQTQGTTDVQTANKKLQRSREYAAAVAYHAATQGIMTDPEEAVIAKGLAIDELIKVAKPEDLHGLLAAKSAIVKATAERAKEWSKDQTAYVLKHSANVSAQFQNFEKNPTAATFDAYAKATIGEQKRLSPTDVPSLVTKTYADSVAAQLQSVTQDEQGAAKTTQILQSQAAVTGRHWDQVSQELLHRKVLTPTQYVASTLYGRPGSTAIAQDLVRASVMKPEDLVNPASGVTRAKAAEAASAALQPLARTLAHSVNGGEVLAAHEKALTDLLLYRGRFTGDDLTGNAEGLANQMIQGDYQFDGSLRVPGNVNMATVKSATDSVMRSIGTKPEFGGIDLIVPPSYDGLGPDARRNAFVFDLQAHGKWVANGDETGVVLIDGNNSQVWRRKKAAKGFKLAPVEYTWAELDMMQAGEAAKPDYNRFQSGGARIR